uniref:Molybdate-anion transporter n=1 Tax=Cyanoptyche gloeocystis TaxID=77922 RepID=A0A7S2JQG3_9EUKA|mmetsp:Transcript_878/g.1544  ORF Transcript_878/g.1544 Transcript_878/m.1544 type:complete len:448 (+) Transcript_878:57-1400(+)
MFYITAFICSLLVCVIVNYSQSSSEKVARSPSFQKFQVNYIAVFLLSMASDWLQGPYVYALYEKYGYQEGDIGKLFIMGFGSSMIFGTVVGSFADKYGRKKNCILYGIIYGASCLTKHSPNFWILMCGRLLGGIATSILFSAFESWMIYEHNKMQFPPELISNTFSVATFGNGVVAIVSGLVASFVAEKFGYVAPFDVAVALLILVVIVVSATWSENYGDQRHQMSTSFATAWRYLINDPKIWMLGAIQSLFEGAMYIFVFKWTPSLSDPNPDPKKRIPIPHGLIFACFMVCVMIGSAVFKFLIARKRVESFSRFMFLLATLTMLVPVLTESREVRFFGFLLFEVCCGIFWPCLGTMRSKYVPEEVRATLMNFFRIPLNLIVVFLLVETGKLSATTIFLCNVGLLSLATGCQHALYAQTKTILQQEIDRALLSSSDMDLGSEDHDHS